MSSVSQPQTPVFRKLSHAITDTLGETSLKVIPWSYSACNFTYALLGDRGGYFAKLFTDRSAGYESALKRYLRERRLLGQNWPIAMPKLRYFSDADQLLVTDEIQGHGVLHFLENRQERAALEQILRWTAAFHEAAQSVPVCEDALIFCQREALFDASALSDAQKATLKAHPIDRLVITKGDMSLQNFKFTAEGAVPIDFEYAGFRPFEYDLVVLIDQMARFSKLSKADLSVLVADIYKSHRPALQSTFLADTLNILSRVCTITPVDKALN
ncbi:phosphotransferase [Shimia sp. R10_1]|uniref:phosphotransferase n=1 Tax=Shimia sp. R10_1 TaxID=2821095 RepID=UPI001ADA340A|nr:phosphotransferase [Shimia sp. R10_1]MBO9474764.1 phosphotransferase [Shimia sp. R10_1]